MSSAILHSRAFRIRRAANWLPLGLTYAFLYMGRYNLTVAKYAMGDLMSLEQFGTIFGVGTLVYALSFLVNGPLTDRIGGRIAILIAAMGAGIANLVMGYVTRDFILSGSTENPTMLFSVLYAVNMYFQSFGAVSIVKVNSNWFHVRERGTFSAIFGAIISSGIWLAFSVGFFIVSKTTGIGEGGVDATWWVFWVPGVALLGFFVVDIFLVRDYPEQAGHESFDTGAAILAEDESKPLPSLVLLKKILSNPIILTVAAIEFCTGVLRNGIMHWYPLYAKSSLVLPNDHFMIADWGLILFVAGVMGGAFAGIVSDKMFQSRRGPAAGALYGGMLVAVIFMVFSLGGTESRVGWLKQSTGLCTVAAHTSQKDCESNGGQWDDVALNKGNGLVAGDLILAIKTDPVQDRARFIRTVSEPGNWELSILRNGYSEKAVISVTKENMELFKFRRNLITIRAHDVGEGNTQTVLAWKGTWAAEKGFELDDRIVSVNGQEPHDWTDFLRKLAVTGTGATVVVERNGRHETLDASYPSHISTSPGQFAKFMAAGPKQKIWPGYLGILAFFISLCVIGTHGLLSGTATMDFGGKRGAATAVGVIDGFVYLGTAVQSFALGYITSRDWYYWPIFLLPFAVIGFLFCLKIWNAKPRQAAGH